MTRERVADRVRELQEDLADGDDLAMAMKLVGDALHRRMRRAHRSIEMIEADSSVGDERFEQLVGRIGSTLQRYEDEAGRGREKLQAVIDEFQEVLENSVRELEGYVGIDEADDEA